MGGFGLRLGFGKGLGPKVAGDIHQGASVTPQARGQAESPYNFRPRAQIPSLENPHGIKPQASHATPSINLQPRWTFFWGGESGRGGRLREVEGGGEGREVGRVGYHAAPYPVLYSLLSTVSKHKGEHPNLCPQIPCWCRR